VPFSQIHKLPKQVEKIIVFSESNFGEKEIEYPLSIAEKNGFDIIYSDSIQHLYDSTPRSVLLILKSNKIVYRNNLKDVNFEVLSKQITANSEQGKTKAPNLNEQKNVKNIHPKVDFNRSIVLENDFLYILYSKKSYIVKISKQSLNNNYDTIFLNSPSIIEKIFSSKYPANFKKKLQQYKLYCEAENMPFLEPSIHSLSFNADTMLIQSSFSNITTDNIDSTLQTIGGITIDRDFAILSIIKDTSVICSQTARYTPNNEGYFFSISQVIKKNTNTIMAVRKSNIDDSNYLLATTKVSNNQHEIDKLLPIYLPQVNIRTGMGYSMGSTFITRDSFLQIMYDNFLYNTINFKKYKLPFYLELYKDNNEKIDFYKLKSHITSFNYQENNFYFTYNSNDSMYFAKCSFEKVNGLKLIKQKYLFPLSHAHELIADKKGIYIFNKEENNIEYKLYNEL
jgi:hypothetical protein